MDLEKLRADVAEAARLLSTPIDFDALVRGGVLEPHGRKYVLRDFEKLPEHAKRQIRSLGQRKDGSVVVSFYRPSKRMAKLHARIRESGGG